MRNAVGLLNKEKAVRFVETMTRSNSIKRKTRYLFMNNEEFVAWHMFYWQMSEDRAKGKWKSDLAKPNAYTEKDDEGELVLAVKKPTEISATDKPQSNKTMAIKESEGMSRSEADKNICQTSDASHP